MTVADLPAVVLAFIAAWVVYFALAIVVESWRDRRRRRYINLLETRRDAMRAEVTRLRRGQR